MRVKSREEEEEEEEKGGHLCVSWKWQSEEGGTEERVGVLSSSSPHCFPSSLFPPPR